MDEAPTTPTAVPKQRSTTWPLLLFAATCYTTVSAHGFEYAVALLAILLSHEFGHFLQARWNRVPATLPYFIPMPAPPIGTMGAVIFMQPGRGDRRAIFDIAITGPLAGLVPAILFSIIGLHMSHVVTIEEAQRGLILGEPLLFKALGHLVFGTLAENQSVDLHPIAFAG